MNNFYKNLSFFTITMIIVLVIFLLNLNEFRNKKELKTQYEIDSLKQEILIKDISLGRCEDMWIQLSKKYPKEAEKIKHYVE